ncbi:putative hydrolase, nudix family [Variovorax paradoxus B4]|uniref:Putative hydrolase, nudix family n=1 Tax=Variovorax paradoxus B4 TaxID=1246301 RepID=T1X880_VARPD|nr:CoA pyrophosphatase [Variovorax paradoxus]AGU48681.1 putative hydrolase, nudix family [Variovorax paradoxus B4]
MQFAPVEPVNAVVPPALLPIDPREAPVVGGPDGLPAVAPAQLAPEALRRRFAAPPEWTPELRREPRMTDRAPAQAAVLVPIVQRPQGATVLLTERTAHLSNHSGQVAFPGGRVDPEDANVAAAALREAWEEVGLSARFIEVLGSLPTYTTITSFIVTPVVALVKPEFELTINPYEVALAFEVPLAWLMDPANHRRHTVPAPDGTRREWYSMPYQDGTEERFVWGATAGMLRNLYRFLSA